jgi:hypothetical protein
MWCRAISPSRIFALSLLLLSLAALPAAHAQAPPPEATAPAATVPAADPTAAKAHQLLQQMIDALGGEAWLNYTSCTQEGRNYSFYHGNPTSAGTLFRRFYQFPDKERNELSKQHDVVYIYNGDKGYETTYKGTAADEDKTVQEVLRRRRHSLEVVVRQWLRDPQTLLFYEGQSVADQQLVDMVTLLNKDNDQLSIGIDVHTHLPISKRYSWRDPDKYKVEDETIYGNYRLVQGIQTPFTITNRRDGEISGQSFLTHAEYNTSFAPGFFNATVTYDPLNYHEPKK